jgi:hypothetical protein
VLIRAQQSGTTLHWLTAINDDGVSSVVNGTNEDVNYMCAHTVTEPYYYCL